MRKSLNNNFLLIFVFFHFMFLSNNAGAQILQDRDAIELIRKGIGHIYNMEFEDASAIHDSIKIMFPDHPVIYLYKGMMIYWQNFPLLPFSEARNEYENELNKCIELTDNNHSGTENEAEYLLANLSARGLLLLFYADNDLSNEVIPLATQTYKPLMRSFNHTSACPDLYYFTGVYNYYRDAYPKVKPIYQAVAFLFPKGDMKAGINQLEICARESMALQAEAYSMLAWIRMQFENDYQKSLPYCQILYSKYPENILFKWLYVKNLLLLKKYDEAEIVMSRSNSPEVKGYDKAMFLVFQGILQEKKYQNQSFARKYYLESIDALSSFLPYVNEYISYAYFGLSRLSTKADEKQLKRYYHRKAMGLSDFKKITFDE